MFLLSFLAQCSDNESGLQKAFKNQYGYYDPSYTCSSMKSLCNYQWDDVNAGMAKTHCRKTCGRCCKYASCLFLFYEMKMDKRNMTLSF